MERVLSYPAAIVEWLDQKGKGAWIILLVVTFVLAWQIGLLLLFYLIWSNRMFSKKGHLKRTFSRSKAFCRSGNTAFDSYKEQTLKRLEDEQIAFEAFLHRLRSAKDQAEFDQFMSERNRDNESTSSAA